MPEKSYFKYDDHQRQYEKALSDPEEKKLAETWLRTDTLDSWRHERIHKPLRVIIDNDPNATWVTVGDGRYGTDAHFLLHAGAKSVHCTDISDTLLRIGNKKGFIKTFSAENAEALSFPGSSFDYVYCKESLHHFPRPYLALYEMFRVARKAVILTEPRDKVVEKDAVILLKYLIKWLFRRKVNHSHWFEPVGNYGYGFSERELEKFMLGMHYTNVAFIGCNDSYRFGVEFVSLDSESSQDRNLKNLIFEEIKRQDFRCKLGLSKPGLITAALFKEEPSPTLASSMVEGGWRLKELPSNPYLNKS
jgi:ubiquinone/menaquinone biosynthesis C-methylase UbiE